MKILAVDIGQRKTGTAWTDTDNNIIFPVELIRHANTEELKNRVNELVKMKKIDVLVVGVPNYPDPESFNSFQYKTGVVLSNDLPIPIEYIDESLTTVEARNMLYERDIQQNNEDIEAAIIILQRFLEKK